MGFTAHQHKKAISRRLFDKDSLLHDSVTNSLLRVNAECLANFLC